MLQTDLLKTTYPAPYLLFLNYPLFGDTLLRRRLSPFPKKSEQAVGACKRFLKIK